MERVYLPEEDMLPSIRMLRLYDTKKVGLTKRTPRRRVEGYEISLYLTDSGILETDGTQYPITRGLVRFSRPGEVICSYPGYSCLTVFFQLGREDREYYNEFLDAIPRCFQTNCAQQILFEQMLELFHSRQTGKTVRLNALLLQLLSSFYRLFMSENSYSDAVKSCIAYMQENLSGKISLETLGELTGYSPLHVLRLFKKDTGLSPHEYLSELRMMKARQMLAETRLGAGQIAAECGFGSESYFQTAFKKANGSTPGEYRRNSLLL